MALNLSKAERAMLEADLRRAKPYTDNAPEVLGLHVEYDHDRMVATMAKSLLERDRREKEAAGHPLEPESTPESERREAEKYGTRFIAGREGLL